jgi:hypothetical protein
MRKWFFSVALVITALASAIVPLSSQSKTSFRESFRSRLDGGNKGVSTNLPGQLRVSSFRIEFEAYPQLEYLEWRCEKVTHVELVRHGRKTVIVYANGSNYRFVFDSPDQAIAFVRAAKACKD